MHHPAAEIGMQMGVKSVVEMAQSLLFCVYFFTSLVAFPCFCDENCHTYRDCCHDMAVNVTHPTDEDSILGFPSAAWTCQFLTRLQVQTDNELCNGVFIAMLGEISLLPHSNNVVFLLVTPNVLCHFVV
jgi:hypothetical protein